MTLHTTTVNTFVDCFVAPYYKMHIIIYIYILPQNSHRWPQCKSGTISIAAGNNAERKVLYGLPCDSDDLPDTVTPMQLFFQVGKEKEIAWCEIR
jgi:hypothetical protein